MYTLSPRTAYLFLYGGLVLVAFPWITTTWALALGALWTQWLPPSTTESVTRYSSQALKWAVVGLGFGLSFEDALSVGASAGLWTLFSISGTLILGLWVTRRWKIAPRLGQLIAVGTAICGGSAIAATAPVIRAKNEEISIALALIFLLNACALFLFPVIGEAVGLSQEEFGLWAALAIHDTSAVVGAAAQYGEEALAIATPLKLSRALWIIPLSLFWIMREGGSWRTVRWPYFMLYFVGAMLLYSYTKIGADIGPTLYLGARILLKLTLFVIGLKLHRTLLARLQVAPLKLAILLWLAVSGVSLLAIVSLS